MSNATEVAGEPVVVPQIIGSGTDVLYILGYIILSSLVIEAISYKLVYHKENWQELKTRTNNLGQKIAQLKNDYLYGTGTQKRQQGKMLKVQQDNFKQYFGQMNGLMWYANMASMGITCFSLYIVSWYWANNVVVGRLPFQPLGMFTSMTHKGLTGDDMEEYSLMFIYMLGQMAVRGMVGKITGNEMLRMPVEMRLP